MGDPGPDDIVTADSLTMALRTAFRPDAAAVAAAPPTTRCTSATWRCACRWTARRCASRSSRRRPRRSVASFPRGSPSSSSRRAPASAVVISGELTPAEAIDEDVIAVVSGDADPAGALRGDVPHRPRVGARARRVTDAAASAFSKGDGHDRPHSDRPVHHSRPRRAGARRAGRGPRRRLPVRRLAGAAVRRRRRAERRRRPSRGSTPCCSAARPTTSSRRTGRTTPTASTARSGGSSTGCPSTSPRAARRRSTGRAATQLGPDLAAELSDLRERHENIHVIGSVDFVQTLLAGAPVRRAGAVGLSDRAGAGQEGLPRRRSAREPRTARTAGRLGERRRAAALRPQPGVPATGDFDTLDREA